MVTLDQKLNWTIQIRMAATTAGQRLGILPQVTHLLTPHSLSTIYKSQVRSVVEYSPLAWMSAAPTIFKKLSSIRAKAAHLIGIPSTNIHSLHHQGTVAAVRTIYKMQELTKAP